MLNQQLLGRTLSRTLHLYHRRFLHFLRRFRKRHSHNKKEFLCLSIILFIFCLRFFIPVSSNNVLRSIQDDSPIATRLFAAPTIPELIAIEDALAESSICSRKRMRGNIERMGICGKFVKGNRGVDGIRKIVGLVEVRNVERTLNGFLHALAETVDSIIVLDDHSSDASRISALKFNNRTDGRAGGAGVHGKVEVLLNKTGEWVREELFDRQLLLEAGREIGGTHFVLLDYDEYLSANCVKNGLLRRKILELSPGESLYMPWVEVWKTPFLHRVMPGDSQMNFLTRRQIVVFADDGKFMYTAETSIARSLGSTGGRNGTIHVLRCPRNICPQPGRYRGRGSALGYPAHVKVLEGCAVVEIRFLNLNNVLLKAAWYEGLGRIMGADDTATRGKMLERIFPKPGLLQVNNSMKERVEDVAVELADPAWLTYKGLEVERYGRVELWRARELLGWIQERGISFFEGLQAMRRIDFGALSAVLEEQPEGLVHVPRVKIASFVVIFESPSDDVVANMLKVMEWGEVKIDEIRRLSSHGIRVSESGQENISKYELFKKKAESLIFEAVSTSSSKQLFARCTDCSLQFKLSLLELIRRELPYLHVTTLFAASTLRGWDSVVFKKAVHYSQGSGSHIRVIALPNSSLGSYMLLHWLHHRLSAGLSENSSHVAVETNAALLSFAESLHRSAASEQFSPVARLLFSLNVGRSGSKYFADILHSVNAPISANHEPACEGSLCSGGGALRMQNRSLASSYDERRRVKLPMIRKAVASIPVLASGDYVITKTISCAKVRAHLNNPVYYSPGTEYALPILESSSSAGCALHFVRDAIYAETNPNFKSWFYDVVLDDMPKAGYSITILVIRKYIPAVLKSLYETGYFTSRDGYNWMETASSVNSHLKVPALGEDSSLDAYEKLLSYLFSSESAFRFIINKYSVQKRTSGVSVNFIETRSERMYSKSGTLELLRKLRLRPSVSTYDVLGVVSDKYRARASKKRHQRTSLELCEKKLQQFLQRQGLAATFNRESFDALARVEGFEYDE